jgi:hypothetical protein
MPSLPPQDPAEWTRRLEIPDSAILYRRFSYRYYTGQALEIRAFHLTEDDKKQAVPGLSMDWDEYRSKEESRKNDNFLDRYFGACELRAACIRDVPKHDVVHVPDIPHSNYAHSETQCPSGVVDVLRIYECAMSNSILKPAATAYAMVSADLLGNLRSKTTPLSSETQEFFSRPIQCFNILDDLKSKAGQEYDPQDVHKSCAITIDFCHLNKQAEFRLYHDPSDTEKRFPLLLFTNKNNTSQYRKFLNTIIAESDLGSVIAGSPL